MDERTDGERLRILFVDDEENVVRSLQRLFMDEDYDVFTASSGAEGLDIVRGNEIAVVVSDQGMPQMRGTEFLGYVKEISPDTVRMVLTGYADLNAAIDAINKGGAYQYITKPWNNDSLILSVSTAVERYKLVKQNRYLTELTNKQNEELKTWSEELETVVQQQTIDLTYKNKELVDLTEKLKRDFQELIVTISNLVELRDKTVANHSDDVAIIAAGMAEKLGLNAPEIETISIAARLHDIGKIGVSDTILLKAIDTLAPYEMLEYKKHPIRGQAVLDANDALREAAALIRSHHESVNGTGFPDGLKGDTIPLGARIIAMADRYDRLLANRPTEAALEEIHSLLGVQFDSELYYPLAETVKELTMTATFANRKMEKVVAPQSLMPGMVLSRELRSGTGVLLASKGITLNLQRITSIKRYFEIDPPDSEGVWVWMDRGGN